MKTMRFKSDGTIGAMRFKSGATIEAWQFDPRDNAGQPDFIYVTTTLSGPRAIVRPAGTESNPNPAELHLAPTDWMLLLPSGVYIVLSDHAAHHLLEEDY